MPNLLTADEAIVGDIKVLTGGQVQKALLGSIARTDTSAKTLGALPAGATLIGLTVYGAAVSNAGTTATISVGFAGGTGAELLSAFDVKGSTGAGQQNPSAAKLGQPGSLASAAQTVTGIYAESGTAGSAGGPWQVFAEFVTATS